MTPTDERSPDRELVQRVEILLSSLSAVVSARVVIDEEEGVQIHIVATSELPVSEVSEAVTSALTWGLGFDVPSNQITVVQSRLSREELQALSGLRTVDSAPTSVDPETTDPPPTSVEPETADPPPAPVEPETADPPPAPVEPEAADPPPAPVEPRSANPPPEDGMIAGRNLQRIEPESPQPRRSTPKPLAPATGLLEFSLGEPQTESNGVPSHAFGRLALRDLQLEENPKGGFAISMSLAYNDRSIGAQREVAGTEEDLLGVPASTALGVIQEFLRAGRGDGPRVVLRFLAARRLSHPQHDTVVVLAEAVVRGRKIPLTGAASTDDGVERASILATLQATNAFVASSLLADSAGGARTQSPSIGG